MDTLPRFDDVIAMAEAARGGGETHEIHAQNA
jgi:hypothetical protein